MPSVERVTEPVSNGYDKKAVKNKYWAWFFNKAFNLMVKKGFLKQQSIISQSINMNRHTIDMDKLDYEICQNQQAIEMVYNKKADTIIVGADIMRKFMTGDPYKIGMIDFNMGDRVSRYAGFTRPYQTNYGLERHYEHLRFMGLNVICVPWFEGFLLIPREERY